MIYCHGKQGILHILKKHVRFGLVFFGAPAAPLMEQHRHNISSNTHPTAAGGSILSFIAVLVDIEPVAC